MQEASFHYFLYGLRLKCNKKLAILHTVKPISNHDVNIEFVLTDKGQLSTHLTEDLPTIHQSLGLAKNGIPYFQVWQKANRKDETIYARFTDGITTALFVIESNGKTIQVFHTDNLFVLEMTTVLIGAILGIWMRLKNRTCLHAGVVNIEGKAVAIIGAKKAGKSTLLATFANLGYPIMADDIAVVFKENNQFYVHAGYPFLRMWEQSLKVFKEIDISKLSRTLSFQNKYYVPLSMDTVSNNWKFQSTRLPLNSIYYLNARNNENSLIIKELSKIEGFFKLRQNLYADYLANDDIKYIDFMTLGELSQQINIQVIDRPHDMTKLVQTCKLLHQDVMISD